MSCTNKYTWENVHKYTHSKMNNKNTNETMSIALIVHFTPKSQPVYWGSDVSRKKKFRVQKRKDVITL